MSQAFTYDQFSAMGFCDGTMDKFAAAFPMVTGETALAITVNNMLGVYDSDMHVWSLFWKQLTDANLRTYAEWCADQVLSLVPTNPRAEEMQSAKAWASTIEAVEYCSSGMVACLATGETTTRDVVEDQLTKLVELLDAQ